MNEGRRQNQRAEGHSISSTNEGRRQKVRRRRVIVSAPRMKAEGRRSEGQRSEGQKSEAGWLEAAEVFVCLFVCLFVVFVLGKGAKGYRKGRSMEGCSPERVFQGQRE